MTSIVIHCRTGFGPDAAAELQAQALARGLTGFCRARPEDAHLVFEADRPGAAAELFEGLRIEEMVFVRQWFLASQKLTNLNPGDRVDPLLRAILAQAPRVGDLFVESPDSEAGKTLRVLCRKLTHPLRQALRLADAWDPSSPDRGHVLMLDSSSAYAGAAPVSNSAPWSAGIPRLKMPGKAPSRSTLKLDEALGRLLSEDERARWLREGMRAVDLGAAPGGWSYQLLRRGLFVTAVDRANMDTALLADGMLEHLREDGFHFQPADPVDWMVCDMVEKPSRVVALVSRWLSEGWCRCCVFNLKLPMKKRQLEVARSREAIGDALSRTGRPFVLRFKQLYHDREEVTGLVAMVDSP